MVLIRSPGATALGWDMVKTLGLPLVGGSEACILGAAPVTALSYGFWTFTQRAAETCWQ